MNKIYFDNASTTQVDSHLFDLFVKETKIYWGNPSAVHSVGQKARASLEKSRLVCANLLGAGVSEIYFCGTATEANNLVIGGVVRDRIKKQPNSRSHILISALEHASVAEFMKNELCDVEIISIDENGVIKIDEIQGKIRPQTCLISVMRVSNEIGTIQPVQEINAMLKEINLARKEENLLPIYLHSDCVQAPLCMQLNVEKLGVDMMVLSGHKIYAPKGVALLYVKKTVELSTVVFGGGQERGLRSGTQNVPMISCFTQALLHAQNNRESFEKHTLRLKNHISEYIHNNHSEIIFNGDNGDKNQQAPHILLLTIPNKKSDELVMLFDLKGICISSGSSCGSGALKETSVGDLLHPDRTGGEVRISLGKQNTLEEVVEFCKVLSEIISG
jgi:cysteine desulfurase